MFAVVLDFTDFVCIGGIMILALSGMTVYLKPRESARLRRLEAKVDLLLAHAGLAYDPKVTVPPDVLDALRRGNKIEAIKLYRESTGIGLAEAKENVEAIRIGPGT